MKRMWVYYDYTEVPDTPSTSVDCDERYKILYPPLKRDRHTSVSLFMSDRKFCRISDKINLLHCAASVPDHHCNPESSQ